MSIILGIRSKIEKDMQRISIFFIVCFAIIFGKPISKWHIVAVADKQIVMGKENNAEFGVTVKLIKMQGEDFNLKAGDSGCNFLLKCNFLLSPRDVPRAAPSRKTNQIL